MLCSTECMSDDLGRSLKSQ